MDTLSANLMLAAEMTPRLFDLDFQLLHDAMLSVIAVIALFVILSYFLFNPVRGMLEKRKNKIKEELDTAAADQAAAAKLRADYESRLKNIDKEAEVLLSEARKKAMANESKIIAEAKEEARNIIQRAIVEAELEKKKAADDMKREMVVIASLMAGKVVSAAIDTTVQEGLIEETLKEIGESTWLS